jgi:tetratricopeptide (TPR) repeat protein
MRIPAVSLSLLLCLSVTAAAQESHAHHHGPGESLGKVNFPTSCSEATRADFTRGLAFLHSFGYEESRDSFNAAASKDPSCGIALWGVAMTYWHQYWAPPSPPELAAGRAASEKATAAGAKTDREKAYIAAIAAFYKDSDKVDHRTRALAYKAAMEDLSKRFPDDHDALIFYALSLLATAPPSDTTYANQKKAAEILNGLLATEPEHPGVAHYLIHSFDYPALASLALPAARSYSKIAPSSAHAQHMPSHIFTRLGLWQESIDSNLASAETARRYIARAHPGAESYDAAHAMDYLEYAYLQIGDEAKAKQIVDQAAAVKSFDEPSFAAGYAIAAIPARYVLERRRWDEAARLEPPKQQMPWERYAYAEAITPFAQALGAARSGQKEKAKAAIARIEEVRARLVKSPIPGPYDWASHVESLRLAASAWLAYADGKNEEALSLARSAADLDEKTGKHPVTPGSILPARELLGEMLLEMKKPAEAMAEYEKSLKETPNRFNGLYGAARAAELSGDSEKARALYAKLLDNLGDRRPDREDAKQARAYLAKTRK